jgi:hypothetical protein
MKYKDFGRPEQKSTRLFRNFPRGFLRRAVDSVEVRLRKCVGKDGAYVRIGISH